MVFVKFSRVYMHGWLVKPETEAEATSIMFTPAFIISMQVAIWPPAESCVWKWIGT